LAAGLAGALVAALDGGAVANASSSQAVNQHVSDSCSFGWGGRQQHNNLGDCKPVLTGTVTKVGSSSFTIVRTSTGATWTVNVNAGTWYRDCAVSSPGFGDIAVNDKVIATGYRAGQKVLDATLINIVPPGSCTITTTTTTVPTTTTSTTTVPTTTTTVPTGNLIPNPGFESNWVPADSWGSRLALETGVVHSGLQALGQTTTRRSGGWDLDHNPAWYADVAPGYRYTASIWVYATAPVRVNIGVDLLRANHAYGHSESSNWAILTPDTWTQLTVSGFQVNARTPYLGMEPDFNTATVGTVIYWDDMSLTAS